MSAPSASSVPVLAYHDVRGRRDAGTDDPWVVGVDAFEEQLDALVGAGWTAAPISELPSGTRPTETRATGTGPTGGKVVYLTFDDGFTSFSRTIVPALAERSMRATVFVPSAFVGRQAEWLGPQARPIMGWQELRALGPAGMEVGSHGHRHLQSDLLSTAALNRELRHSREVLQEGLGHSVDSLAYPFGYNDRRTRAAAAASGYKLACEMSYGLHPLRPDRRFAVRRLVVGPEVTGAGLLDLLERGQRSASRDWAYRAARPAWRTVRHLQRRAGNRPGRAEPRDRNRA